MSLLNEDEPIDKDYLENCVKAISNQLPMDISIDECINRFGKQEQFNESHITIGEKYIISLLTQNNLLLDKLCTVLLVAVGLRPEDVGDVTKEDAEEMVGKTTMCGSCGGFVIPNDLGYCPRCKNDLRKQISQESLNKL